MIEIIKINIKLNKNIIKFLYKFINNLPFFDNNKKSLRLYILIIIKIKIF